MDKKTIFQIIHAMGMEQRMAIHEALNMSSKEQLALVDILNKQAGAESKEVREFLLMTEREQKEELVAV